MYGFSDALLGQVLFAETMFTARVLGILLWSGLAVLAIALLVLMRTGWGQARPLSKCVALSVFAHVLLVGYAYGTKLIFDPPPPMAGEVIYLSFVGGDEESQTGNTVERQPKPWEQLTTDTNLQPELSLPERLDANPQLPTQRMDVAQLPDNTLAPPTDAFPVVEPQRPTVEPPAPDVVRVSKSDVQPAEIETPAAATRQDAVAVAPVASGPDRIPTTVADSSPPKRPTDTDLPSELTDVDSRLQRLADVAAAALPTDAVANPADALKATTNRSQSDRDSGDAGSGGQKSTDTRSPTNTANSSSPNDPKRAADANSAASAAPVPRRLGDGAELPTLYRYRVPSTRLQMAEQHGGSARTEAAVNAALKWLAANQSPDGRWDASAYGAGFETKVLGHDRGGAGTDADTGITGLALLAFLGAGHSHLEGEYRTNVQHGLEFLLRSQRPDGSVAGDARLYERMYCHGIASLALSEAFAISGDYRLKPFVERAVKYTIAAQHQGSGGWRYQPGDAGDMSQFGWQVMALKSAELCGIEVPGQTRAGMLKFLRSASSGTYGGLASYRPAERASRTMTAEALTCRYFLQVEQDEAALREATAMIGQELPADGKANLYYWYYATLALYQTQDETWQRWNSALQQQLIGRQRTEGGLAGSWDTDTVWGGYGGRVYTTAMAALCLEVYYRYLPLYANDTAAK
jgi:hypothetical protein